VEAEASLQKEAGIGSKLGSN